MDRLDEILQEMDVPKFRRDTSSRDNLSWLLRNLPINNSECDDAIDLTIRRFNEISSRTNDEP